MHVNVLRALPLSVHLLFRITLVLYFTYVRTSLAALKRPRTWKDVEVFNRRSSSPSSSSRHTTSNQRSIEYRSRFFYDRFSFVPFLYVFACLSVSVCVSVCFPVLFNFFPLFFYILLTFSSFYNYLHFRRSLNDAILRLAGNLQNFKYKPERNSFDFLRDISTSFTFFFRFSFISIFFFSKSDVSTRASRAILSPSPPSSSSSTSSSSYFINYSLRSRLGRAFSFSPFFSSLKPSLPFLLLLLVRFFSPPT